MVLINTVQYCKCIFSSYDFVNNIFFFIACFVIRIWYIINITYKICAIQLFMLSVRVNSGLLLAVKFRGSQKLYADFQLCVGLAQFLTKQTWEQDIESRLWPELEWVCPGLNSVPA